MTPIYESQLHELCAALGWHGGTYHQVLQEVASLRAINAQLVEALRSVIVARVQHVNELAFSYAMEAVCEEARAAIAAATKDQP